MYSTQRLFSAVEKRLGAPAQARAAAVFSPAESALIARCGERERAHDVTLFIPRGAPGPRQFAVIRKPSYPPNLFRPPSGGVEPGEPLEAGASREAWEETGLRVTLRRYVLRVQAEFACAQESIAWVTHVFLTDPTGGAPAPVDRKEIAEARWATVDEMHAVYRPLMLATGTAGFRYRVDLEATVLHLLGLAPPSQCDAFRLEPHSAPAPAQGALC